MVIGIAHEYYARLLKGSMTQGCIYRVHQTHLDQYLQGLACLLHVFKDRTKLVLPLLCQKVKVPPFLRSGVIDSSRMAWDAGWLNPPDPLFCIHRIKGKRCPHGADGMQNWDGTLSWFLDSETVHKSEKRLRTYNVDQPCVA